MCDLLVPRVPHSTSPLGFESSRHLGGGADSDPNISDTPLSVHPSHIRSQPPQNGRPFLGVAPTASKYSMTDLRDD